MPGDASTIAWAAALRWLTVVCMRRRVLGPQQGCHAPIPALYHKHAAVAALESALLAPDSAGGSSTLEFSPTVTPASLTWSPLMPAWAGSMAASGAAPATREAAAAPISALRSTPPSCSSCMARRCNQAAGMLYVQQQSQAKGGHWHPRLAVRPTT